MKNYSNLDRGNWAALKLSSVVDVLPNRVVSDIGSGWGWFRPIVERFNLEWQPLCLQQAHLNHKALVCLGFL